jgi:hypothetical protein
MPTLHALFASINQYPAPVKPLSGCINDMEDFKSFLNEYCKYTGMIFRPKVLIDEEATRNNIIDGFDHFQDATDGDRCVFYFSGHGSRLLAPEALADLKPGGIVESLVCYDSIDLGKDLLDKELSYLLWKAVLDESGETKDIPFLLVTDCCHSGAVTRLDVTERRHLPLKVERFAHPIEEFLGIDDYRLSKENKYSPPRGHYVHLGACRREETAKELKLGTEQRGLFTYTLVKALQDYGFFMSYSELISRVQVRVRNQFGTWSPQNPQAEAPYPEDMRFMFLTKTPLEEKELPVVSYHHDKYRGEGLGWIVNRGSIHGIPKGSADQQTRLELIGEQKIVSVKKVLADCSLLSGMEKYNTDEDKKRSFAAKIIQYPVEKVSISVGKYAASEGMHELKKAYSRSPSNLFHISEDAPPSDFRIQAKEAIEFEKAIRQGDTYEYKKRIIEGPWFYLSGPKEELPLFEGTKDFSEESARIFLKKLEVVAHWMQLLKLRNPDASISSREIKIEFFESTEPWNKEDDTNVKLVDWENPSTLKYMEKDGKWHSPIIQVRITNTGPRPLWVSLLYLGDDFSVTNQLLRSEKLNPGEHAWALYIHDGIPCRSIPIRITPEQLEAGVFYIHEYLKLIICTTEFSTDSYVQEGLSRFAHGAENTRSAGRLIRMSEPDWKSLEIPLFVQHPQWI